jgi:AraC-like DNA-binding protein
LLWEGGSLWIGRVEEPVGSHAHHAIQMDPRVARATEWLRGALDGPVTLARTAAAVALSPGRFRHLFVAETGLTFRAYVLWLRLSRAVELVAARRPVTEAAHAAGFADAAHLSRTFRRTFGVAPAMLDPR